MIFVWAALGVITAELTWKSIMWISVKIFYREKETGAQTRCDCGFAEVEKGQGG